MSWLDHADPDILRFVREMREDWKRYPDTGSMSLPEMRVAAAQVRARWAACGPRMAETREFTFDPGAGPLRLRMYRPAAAAGPLPAMVYLHGGGFTLFSIDTHDRLMREYAHAGGFAVLGVDYPLAPEAKYPVALDHIEALMHWLSDNAGEWGLDNARLALGGDSAGANLSFATFQRLRTAGKGHAIKAILANYAGLGPRVSDESEALYGGAGSIMDRAEVFQYWENYLRGPEDENDPEACPLIADLTGFPPVMLVVAELDIVAEDSLRMHRLLTDAGVDATCEVYPGATHSFLEAMSISDLARRGIADGARFIAGHIGPAGR